MQTIFQNLIQSLNIISLLGFLGCIFTLWTDKQLTICIIFRWLGIGKRGLKTFFSVLSMTVIIRLAAYITDFNKAGSPPYAIYMNAALAVGFVLVTIKIYVKRHSLRKRAIRNSYML